MQIIIKEKDVILTKNNEVILIECKLNPQNHDIKRVLSGMEEKINKYPYLKKSCQLWFWEKLSIENKYIIEKATIAGNNIRYVEVSNHGEYSILSGISIKSLKNAMRDYTKNNDSDDLDIVELKKYSDFN